MNERMETPNANGEYDNSDPRCRYPKYRDPLDYCWSYAHHVDGTRGYDDMSAVCRGRCPKSGKQYNSCEFFKEVEK